MLKKLIVLIFLFLTALPLFSAELDTLFAPYLEKNSPTVLTSQDTHKLFLWASLKVYNVFDLMDEVGLYLSFKNLRLTLKGEDLRNESRYFKIGDSRVDTLLPLSKLISITLGAKNGTDNEVEILLSSTHSGFLELGDFFIEKRYGFKNIRDKTLLDAYGIKVKNGFFTFDLDKIERVSDPTGKGSHNFIGINLRNFPRAKRWLIDPVKQIN